MPVPVIYSAGYVGTGRKVHLALGGVPNCPGVRRMSRVSPLVEFGESTGGPEAIAAKLTAKGVPASHVCGSCLGRVADLMVADTPA